MKRKGKGSSGGGGHDGAGSLRWLLTYADLITLLMAFFIIMYAVSSINTARYASLANSLRLAFHSDRSQTIVGQRTVRHIIPLQKPKTQHSSQNLSHLYQQVQQYIAQHHLGKVMTVTQNKQGVTIIFLQKLLFPLGTARIRSGAYSILHDVAKLLAILPNQIDVRGYTDNEPIHTLKYPSNWQLSAERAIRVVGFLIGTNLIKPGRLRATAFSQYHPFVPNTTAANRQLNRRVEIFIMHGTH